MLVRRCGWVQVVGAGFGIFLAQLDTTIVTLALPAIGDGLNVGVGVVQWVMLGYLVPIIALSLTSGRWVDRIGPGRALRTGVVAFGLLSLVSAIAPNLAVLVLARAAKGASAALLMAAAPTLAVGAVEDRSRAKALAVVSTLAPLGGMCGPVAGGTLLKEFGWRAVFLASLPVVVIVLTLVRGTGAPGPRPAAGDCLPTAKGVALLGIAAAALLTGLTPRDDGTLAALWLLPVGVLFTVWWWRARGAKELAPLATPTMPTVHFAFAGAYLAVLATQFLIPFYMSHHLAAGPAVIGAVMVAYPAATAFAGPVSGWAADRWGDRRMATAGAALLSLSLVVLAPLAPEWSPAMVAARLAIVGLGFGLFVTPNQSLALSLVPRSETGLASASTNLARVIGLAAGPATATAIWATSGYVIAGMRSAIAVVAVAVALSATSLALARPVDVPRPSARARGPESQHS